VDPHPGLKWSVMMGMHPRGLEGCPGSGWPKAVDGSPDPRMNDAPATEASTRMRIMLRIIVFSLRSDVAAGQEQLSDAGSGDIPARL